MNQYHKINSLFKRSTEWEFTEKVDGTNIRVMYHPAFTDGNPDAVVLFGGKTDNAQIPANLVNKLKELFPLGKFRDFDSELCLYGEGYGANIQKGGGNYISNGVDFVLFDVKIGDWWLKRVDVEDIATKLSVQVVPIIGRGTLEDMIDLCDKGFKSQWGDFIAEGIVARPVVELRDRAGHRIITKLKHKDFKDV
jgi:ATP-dependent RNA circularization protein (DNA/RNA ligase family)